MQGFAAHYYCGAAGTATEYTEDQWLELLAKAGGDRRASSPATARSWTSSIPQRKIKLIFDEWGAWHPVEKGKPGGGLYQQNTIRDACVAALSLDIFHNHADKLFMANIAQLINVLQALLLVEDDKCIKTPTYHVFDLYRPHKGGQAVRFVSAAETISDGGASAEPAATATATSSRSRCAPCRVRRRSRTDALRHGRQLPSPAGDRTRTEVQGSGRMETVEVVTLAADDIHAHNTFERPEVVRLSAPTTLPVRGTKVRVPLPAGSVVRVMGRLG